MNWIRSIKTKVRSFDGNNENWIAHWLLSFIEDRSWALNLFLTATNRSFYLLSSETLASFYIATFALCVGKGPYIGPSKLNRISNWKRPIYRPIKTFFFFVWWVTQLLLNSYFIILFAFFPFCSNLKIWGSC